MKITDKQVAQLMKRRNLPKSDAEHISREQMQEFLEHGRVDTGSSNLGVAMKDIERFVRNASLAFYKEQGLASNNSEPDLWFETYRRETIMFVFDVFGHDLSLLGSKLCRFATEAFLHMCVGNYDQAISSIERYQSSGGLTTPLIRTLSFTLGKHDARLDEESTRRLTHIAVKDFRL